ILTSRGGMTSHAAVVARGMGTSCVAGAGDLHIDYKAKKVKIGGKVVKEGEYVSLNGSLGTVYAGQIKTQAAKLSGNFQTLMKWADEARTMNVRTNADTPGDARAAVEFGAEGIGLCRTEHMFFEGDRIISVRKMILAEDTASREKALKELLPLQRKDFEGIFKAMKGKPVTIRLIDPPLHEFVPHEAKAQQEMAKVLKVPVATVKAKVDDLHEFNPMLGHRGCRLGITYPEIVKMQARAIIEAAINVKKAKVNAKPEIMIPLVGNVEELTFCKQIILETIKEVFKQKKTKVPYMIGTMIEVPRAAITADEIAREAEFFSFGTNDLTQMTCGFSRDDSGKFLKEYVDLGIYEKDPFQVLDQDGVGKMVQIGVDKGRSVRKNLKIGICGEHGGEPNSVEFCHSVGMNYVSCSPFRVPIARLAAAQAAIKEKQAKRAAKKKKK
ncbi:MAG: pyruvate, phosphate dikinase, partial [Deltaproteobacteria bacterium]|nr:pyruvate, phosphate dikinase [Deltaproteobacteria bacterium]